MDIGKLKKSITDEVDMSAEKLKDLALKIHSNPELGFDEVKAAGWLTGYLKDNGFSVEEGICELPTAFRGTYGEGSPVVALLAEYDALPGLGHACGHNLIGTAAVGAAAAAKQAIDQFGGTIMVIGTPAEEIHGGKAIMAERDAFNNLDAVMMMHPGVGRNSFTSKALAAQNLDVDFYGKPAHSAANPEDGINALEALIQSFNAINSLRQHTKDKVRIQGIITDGGKVLNIVPVHGAASFMIRADEDAYFDELKEKVLNCFEGAAVSTGARLEYKWGDARYATMRSNLTLSKLCKENMESLGRTVTLSTPERVTFSTDVGNVSHLVPTISASVAMGAAKAVPHSPPFAEAAASDEGLQSLIDGAKAMAMTVCDLVSNPDAIAKIKAEFETNQ